MLPGPNYMVESWPRHETGKLLVYKGSMYMEPTLIFPHKLLAGDLTEGDVQNLMGQERASVVYTDPPWGQGMVTNFSTGAGVEPKTWPLFLEKFAHVCYLYSQPEAPIFVEMGCKWVGDLDAAMREMGLIKQGRWETTYSAHSPCTLSLYFKRLPEKSLLPTMDFSGHGTEVPKKALQATVQPGGIVLDPCTGFGTTAKITHKLGGHFRGLELSPKRLERAVTWLQGRKK